MRENIPVDMGGHWNCGICNCSWKLKEDAKKCCKDSDNINSCSKLKGGQNE